MKTLFFDCKNGISGDMVLHALMELSGIKEQITEALKQSLETHHECEQHKHNSHENDCHAQEHHHHHIHGRSWLKVRQLIEQSRFSDEAKAVALNIYQNIAEAEASVHGETLETIHFHEVGRDEAIKNALGIGMALEAIKPDEILTSPIYDGKGSVVCSHGEIPVPVPAVMALRAKCSYTFETADVNMEMVTPSGLASLMGIGARPDSFPMKTQAAVIAETEARGSRDTGRDGLKVYLLDRRDK